MFSVTLLVIVIISIFLSSCAYLLSNIVSGSGNMTYTAKVYINGMPKKMVEDLSLSAGEEVIYSGSFSAKFSVQSVPKYEVPYTDFKNLFNGIGEYSIVMPPANSIEISSKITLSYSTDTTVSASEITFEFEDKNFPLSENKFYIVFDFLSDSYDGTVAVIPYSKAYKFTIKTSKREYVNVFEVERYRLISENIGGTYQCVFIGEKGKTYTFESSGYQKTIAVPQDTDKDGEIVDLSG